MVLIGFLAKSKSGKSLASNYIVSKYKFKSKAFADPLKNGIKCLFGFTDEQINTEKKEIIDKYWGISPRNVLQIIGTNVVRNNFSELFDNKIDGKNFWIKNFDKWYKEELKDDPRSKVVITDVRFQNEVDYIKSLGGIIVKIHRPIIEKNKDNMYNHESEINIDNITNYHCIILNDNTIDNFYKKIDKLILYEHNIRKGYYRNTPIHYIN